MSIANQSASVTSQTSCPTIPEESSTHCSRDGCRLLTSKNASTLPLSDANCWPRQDSKCHFFFLFFFFLSKMLTRIRSSISGDRGSTLPIIDTSLMGASLQICESICRASIDSQLIPLNLSPISQSWKTGSKMRVDRRRWIASTFESVTNWLKWGQSGWPRSFPLCLILFLSSFFWIFIQLLF